MGRSPSRNSAIRGARKNNPTAGAMRRGQGVGMGQGRCIYAGEMRRKLGWVRAPRRLAGLWAFRFGDSGALGFALAGQPSAAVPTWAVEGRARLAVADSESVEPRCLGSGGNISAVVPGMKHRLRQDPRARSVFPWGGG